MVSYYFLDQNEKKKVFFSHIEIVWENHSRKSPNAWKKRQEEEGCSMISHTCVFFSERNI